MFEFGIKFQWNVFLGIKFTINQHWFKWWLGTMTGKRFMCNEIDFIGNFKHSWISVLKDTFAWEVIYTFIFISVISNTSINSPRMLCFAVHISGAALYVSWYLNIPGRGVGVQIPSDLKSRRLLSNACQTVPTVIMDRKIGSSGWAVFLFFFVL